MNPDSVWTQMNDWGRERLPFVFMIDFEIKKPLLFRLDQIDPDVLRFSFRNSSNHPGTIKRQQPLPVIRKMPIPFDVYQRAFDQVMREIRYGNTFLLNLTFPTRIDFSRPLSEIYDMASAPYKLWYNNEFVVFSPEAFISVADNKIKTFPMKGTADADDPSAEEKLMNDLKEKAEHFTIVDLLRNDLSMVAGQVKVNRYRYVEKIRTNQKTLLQTSSEIEGQLSSDWHAQIGDIMKKLLPAGSISGAPKKKTVEIIAETEVDERGYYTGVMGLFDGVSLDSAVMIRYIEQKEDHLIYRSGCGITFQSQAESEYQEMLDKVYVPVD
jgi:para-aminobenzoate synthetase component 1